MTNFKTDGFLSSEISEFEKEIQCNFRNKLDLAYEVNRLAHKIIYSVDIDQHLTDLLLATLLTRQMSSFQAFLILLEKGLLTQAEIILRNISETMFIVGAIGKDKNFADKYTLAEEVSRKKALVRLKKNFERNGKKIDQQTIDLIAEIDEKIRDQDIQTFSTERIAKIAGLSNYYDTLYPLTSMAVHTSARGLDKALEVDDEGKVLSVDYGPKVDELDMHLDYGISMTLYTLHEIAVQFKLETEEIESLQQRNNELSGSA